jgi:uncharacterized protein YbjT (DUF2867 family)
VRIFLTGATGFVGGHLLPRLLKDGHSVRALTHDRVSESGSRLRHLQSAYPETLALTKGDIVSAEGLSTGIRGCDAVIHLVGIILETRGASFEQIHVLGTQNVVRAAQAANVKRFVQMSALGARPNSASAYQRTKYRGEEAVRNSGISHVILRPSLIFGAGDGFVSQMVGIMKSSPLFRPVVGTGKYRFRPIYIDDVVECFAQSLTNAAASGETIELVGGEELTLEKVLQRVADCIGVNKPAVRIPMPLMKMAAKAINYLPFRPPVTIDQLRMLEEGSTADPEKMMRIFGISPVKFSEGLGLYLYNASPGDC